MSATTFPDAPIIAIATAPGRGGIGVLRLSGRNLAPLAQALLGRMPTPRHAHYLPFRDAQGEPMDHGIALFFPAPHSYTGEDVLELQGHGGTAVLHRLLAHCLEAGRPHGLRHAEPGEFTRRAFLNDRMDLAQAEAVADLINATSEAAARGAAASLSGAFSREVNALNERIIHLRMLVEATLDFPEEEIDFLEKYQARPLLAGIRGDLDTLLRHARQGRVLRDGLRVVLAGRPNVGKSSLLNALAGDDVALVTDIPGTTRDRIVQHIHLDGVPLHLIDTAGLRQTEDTVERLGIARSWEEIARADAILHLQDAREPDEALDEDIARRLPAGIPVLRVRNKCDLLAADGRDLSLSASSSSSAPLPSLSSTPSTAPPPQAGPAATADTPIYISARTGEGLDQLRRALLALAGWQAGEASPWLARQRHLDALGQADEHLALAETHAAMDDRVLDLFAEELRLAHVALGEITGEFSSDDLLGKIFSTFCIGK